MEKSQPPYSMSRPSHRWMFSLVPDSMTHVPLFSASVSMSHRYKVGTAIDTRVEVNGKPMMNWYERLLDRG